MPFSAPRCVSTLRIARVLSAGRVADERSDAADRSGTSSATTTRRGRTKLQSTTARAGRTRRRGQSRQDRDGTAGLPSLCPQQASITSVINNAWFSLNHCFLWCCRCGWTRTRPRGRTFRTTGGPADSPQIRVPPPASLWPPGWIIRNRDSDCAGLQNLCLQGGHLVAFPRNRQPGAYTAQLRKGASACQSFLCFSAVVDVACSRPLRPFVLRTERIVPPLLPR